jgi:PhnB protein
MDDGRKAKLIFERTSNGTKIIESFDPENENPAEMQRGGWQAILDNFKKYVELTLNSKTPMLTPYLNFNGDCRQAMLFYSGIFGGFLAMQTFGESGMAKKSADNDRIIHATLKTADLNFMASDGRPDLTVKFGDSVAMSLGGSDEKKLRGFFKKLSVGGNVTMPLEKQFWGDVFGMLTDRFGVHWMVNISQQKL